MELVILSIEQLATVAGPWLAKGPAALLEVSGLTAALVKQARAAGDLVAKTGADAVDVGPAIIRDTPAVNLVEGWVLEEMLRLRDDFEQAHDADSQIPRLVPGKATRRVLARPRTRSARASRRVVAQAKAALAKGQPGRRMNGAASA